MGNFRIPRLLVIPVYIAILVAFSVGVAFVAKLFGAYNPTAWGFFSGGGILLGVILAVWARQLWWIVSGTGDYAGREGFLLRLYKKIFKK